MTWGKVSLVCWFVTLQAGHTVKILGDGQQLIRTEVGHSLSLDCEYKLEGDSLYSLKWYRDDREFFRYIPQESPPVTIFLLHGISVSDSSSPTRLVLKNTSLSTSGSVKCEVSAGPPRFQTDIKQVEVQVVALPSQAPKILGVKGQYEVGDLVMAQCLSPVSVPPVTLSWYINSDSAVSGEVGPQEDMASSAPEHSIHSVLPLRLTIRRHHIGEDGRIRLKCTASVLDLYWRTAEEVAQVMRLDTNSWSLPFSSSPPKLSPKPVLILFSILNIQPQHFKTTSLFVPLCSVLTLLYITSADISLFC